MKAIASPLHQKLKFPSEEGVMVVKGKQEDEHYCFGLAVQSVLNVKHPAELPEDFRLRAR